MSYSQDNLLASVSVADIKKDTLLFYRMNGTEQFSRLFEYEVEVLSENAAVDLQSLLGKVLTVKLSLDIGSRFFNGIITRAIQLGPLGRLYHYKLIVHPKVWLLTRASNCRVASPKKLDDNEVKTFSVPDIVKNVLNDHGYTDIKSSLKATYQPREFCVQYRETDFNFINRLLEEEGIYYCFEHTETTHTLVLYDDMQKHEYIDGNSEIQFHSEGNAILRGNEFITEWNFSHHIQTGAYRLKDYNFEMPTADLVSISSIQATHAFADKEIYDYPGEFQTAGDGDKYAKIRMEEHRAAFEQISGKANVRRLKVGEKFKLSGSPRSDQNDQEYLTVSLQFHFQNSGYDTAVGGGDEGYQCSFNVIRKDITFRPPRITPLPVVRGMQTAVVVGQSKSSGAGDAAGGGQSSDEIATDKYGRVKVQFNWDRLGVKDQNSSCWLRVAQIWAGKNWGGMFIPRVGQEVIVDFLEGNPDCPIIIGSLYNANQMPPYDLPANQTRSGIKTRSSPNGQDKNYNEIRFEDKKDSEEVYFQAEKDLNCVIKNNETRKVGSSDSKDGDGNQTEDIYNNRTVTLQQGADQLTLKKGDRTVTISQGNDNLKIKQGNLVVKVSTGKMTADAATSIELTVGSNNIKIDTSAITLTAGSNSIKLDASGITVSGLKVSIKGDTMAEFKSAMTTLSGDGVMTIKGGIVKIN
jgi:type VI secretion system secreted protein VgrG